MIHDDFNDKQHLTQGQDHEAIVSRSVMFTYVLLAVVAVTCTFILPHLYGFLAFGPSYAEQITAPIRQHIALNCIANTLVILPFVISANVGLHRKFARLLATTLLIHGCLAFFILVARQPYSNLMLSLGVLISAVGGTIILYIRHRTAIVRIALVGPIDDAIAEQLQGPYERVSNPAMDLRSYDVLLTAGVVDLSHEWTQTLSRAMLSGKSVRHLVEYIEESRGLVSIDHFDVEHIPTGGLTSYRAGKRVLDIGLVVLAAPIALPILVVGMFLVLVTMGRPIFFTQTRVGLGGARFQMHKLRSMRPIALSDTARTTTSGDARITPVGRWLRRFRVDELPQLWNVLKGEMSVIGPRPEWSVLSEQYISELPVYAYRHLVRPGITGWAQVRSGYAGDLAETRIKVAHDLFYIKNLSLVLDLQILARTVWTLITGRGVR